MKGGSTLSFCLIALLVSSASAAYRRRNADGSETFSGLTSDIGLSGGGYSYEAGPYAAAAVPAAVDYTAKLASNVINLDEVHYIDSSDCISETSMSFHVNDTTADLSAWTVGTVVLGPLRLSCSPTNGRMTQFSIKLASVGPLTDSAFTVTFSLADMSDVFETLNMNLEPSYDGLDPAADNAQNIFSAVPTNTRYATSFNTRGDWSWNPFEKEVYSIGDQITASWNPGSNKKTKLRLLKQILRPIIFGKGYSKEVQKWDQPKGARSATYAIEEGYASSFFMYFQIQRNCILGWCDEDNSDKFSILGKGFNIGWNYDPNSQAATKRIPLFHIGCKKDQNTTTPDAPDTPPTPDSGAGTTGDTTGETPITPDPIPDDPEPTPGPDGPELRRSAEAQHAALARRGFCDRGSYVVDLSCSNCYVQASGNYYKLTVGKSGASVYAVGEFSAVAQLDLLASAEWGIKGGKELMSIPLVATPRFSVLGFHFGFGIYGTATLNWEFKAIAQARAHAGIAGSAKFELTLDTSKPISPNFTKNFVITKPTYSANAKVQLTGALAIGPSIKVEVANANAVDAGVTLTADANTYIEFELKGFPARDGAPHPNALMKFDGACGNPHYIEFDSTIDIKVVLRLGGKFLKDGESTLYTTQISLASGCLLKTKSRSVGQLPSGLTAVYNPTVDLILDATVASFGYTPEDLKELLRVEVHTILGISTQNMGIVGSIDFADSQYKDPSDNSTGLTIGGKTVTKATLGFVDTDDYTHIDTYMTQLKIYSYAPSTIPAGDYFVTPKMISNPDYNGVTLGSELNSAASVAMSVMVALFAVLIAF